MKTIYIETNRLILRDWTDADRKPFAGLNGNPEVMRFFPSCLTPEESDAFVDRIIAEIQDNGYGLYAVELKGSGEFIGYTGFHRFNFDASFSPGWEIGWRLSDRFWHKGYATEAASACIDYARENRLFSELFSFTATINTPSENVMKRIGMTYCGRFGHPSLPEDHRLREHVLYKLKLSAERTDITRCTVADYPILAEIWERSVRATHDFLTENDIAEIKTALATVYFPNVELFAIRNESDIAGFIGLSGNKIEMLFIDSGLQGLGYGSALMDFAVSCGATAVDVNEQNPAALRFYLAKGFRIVSRDEKDEAGRPYPLLNLSL